MAYVKRCMIVAAPYVETARSLAEGLAGTAGVGMFMFPLSSSGEEPPSHFLTEGHIEETFSVLITNSGALHQACQEAGVELPLSYCEALLSACDVSEDNPFTAMERLALKPVLPEEI